MPTKHASLLGLAGLISAGLFLAPMGSLHFLPLHLLTPLPLFCVGIAVGFSSLAVVSLISVAVVALAAPIEMTIDLVLFHVTPTLFAVRQVFLCRQLDTGEREWYPLGRILGGLTVYFLFVLIMAMAWFSGEEGGLAGHYERITLEAMKVLEASGVDFPSLEPEKLSKIIFVGPGVVGALWLIILTVNGALAQGLMAGFQGLRRPKLALADVSLPTWLACLLVPSMVMLTFGNSGLAFFGGVATLVLLAPFLLQGLGVVHRWVARTKSPGLLLTGFYLTMLLLAWPILLTIAVGLADQWLDFRGLRAKSR